MPRMPRLEYPQAFYHVFNRGNRKERIFWNSDDHRMFEKFMLLSAGYAGIKLYAWCLMPNHFHMLIETPEGNLSQFMHVLSTRYAKNFNITHKLVGHVFQGRYRAVLCDKEAHLLELVRYIHLNPIKAKSGALCERPENYPWSSYKYYAVGNEPLEIRLPIHEVLKRFGNTVEVARYNFEKYVAEGLTGSNWEDFYKVKERRFLGSEAFAKEIEEKKAIQQKNPKIRAATDLAKILLGTVSVREEEIRSKTQSRNIGRIRKAFVHVGSKYCKIRLADLARYLNKDISAISKMISRAKGGIEQLSETHSLKDALGI